MPIILKIELMISHDLLELFGCLSNNIKEKMTATMTTGTLTQNTDPHQN